MLDANDMIDSTSKYLCKEIDSTKGKPGIRGKFLRARPDVFTRHQKPYNQLKSQIIKNGSFCNPLCIDGRTICVINTCAFDSIIELLAHASVNVTNFLNLFTQVADLNIENSIFDLVISYMKEGA